MIPASIILPHIIGPYHLQLDTVLGIGSNASVHLAIHLPTEKRVAVKIIPITSQDKRDRALFELLSLRELTPHANIVQLYDFFEYCGFFLLFLEYLPCGDLASFVHCHGRLDESLARTFFCQMVLALENCHQHNIVHHDFKLENLLLASRPLLRLIDFGLAQSLPPNQMIQEFVGSPLYMPPEIFLLQPHNQQVDIWSLGVCLYYIVTDLFPFTADTYHELEEKVLFGEVAFPANMRLSEDIKQLIGSMLERNPEKRITLELIKAHPWLNSCLALDISRNNCLQNNHRSLVKARLEDHTSDN